MKKVFWLLVYSAISVALLFLVECDNEKSKNNIYVPNREWKFTVKRTNSQSIDTLRLKVVDKFADKVVHEDEMGFEWILSYSDTNKIQTYRDTTYYTWKVNNNDIIKIPFSSIRYLKYSAATPHPEIRLPVYIGRRPIKIERKTTFSDVEEMKGLKITGEIKVVDKIFYDNPIVNDSCWVLDAVGNSKFGTLKARYYFHKTMGFVYLYYDFNKYEVEAELVDFNKKESKNKKKK